MAVNSATFDQFANALQGSGDPSTMAVGAALQAVNRIVASLGIGTGRQEADRIVPYQNELADLLDVANQAMGDGSVSAAHLTEIKRAVVESGESFRDYIQDRAQFPDGRASRQAESTMFGQPGYLRVTVENLDKTIAERGGVAGTVAGALGALGGGGSSGLLILAGLGLLALLLFRK